MSYQRPDEDGHHYVYMGADGLHILYQGDELTFTGAGRVGKDNVKAALKGLRDLCVGEKIDFTKIMVWPRKEEVPPDPDHVRFRAVGFTKNALNYPLSEAGFAWVCRYNGVTPDNPRVPKEWRYAPNEAMRQTIERLAINSGAEEGVSTANDAN